MTQPICLITGATEGVGRITALELARRDFRVVVAARNPAKADALQRASVALGASGKIESLQADLASVAQVRALADAFRARYSRLDVLINNAGVFLPARTETADGLETTFQVNYVSHFLLTRSLLPELKRSTQGRIINLTSSVYAVGRFEPDNLQSERRFSVLGTYAASKLFMLMFTEELAQRLASTQVTANAVHPGIVRTQMMLGAPGAFRALSYLSLPFSSSPEQGARTSIHLATSPGLARVTGRYFAGSRPRTTRSRFDTPENRARLWELSARLIEPDAQLAPQAG